MSIPDWLSVVFAWLVIMASGAGLLRSILRDETANTPILERIGLWWVLGTGYVSLMIFAVGWVIRGPALVALITAGTIAMFVFRTRSARVPTKRWSRFDVLDWMLFAVILGEMAYVLWLAPQSALGWDGIVLWEAKARVAMENGGVLPLRYFHDIPFPLSQPRYPLFLPYVETWIYLCLGEPHQAWARSVGPFAYAAAIFIVAGAAERLGSSRKVGLISSAAFFTMPYLWIGHWNALTGYADFPLGVLYLAAVARLTSVAGTASKKELTLFGILAGLTVWGKHEGFYLWLVLMIIAGVFLRSPRNWRQGLLVASPGLIIAAVFGAYLRYAGAPKDPWYLEPTPANVLANADRIGPVFWRLGKELTTFNSWSYLWIGALGAVIALACWRRIALAFGFGVAIGFPLFLFVWPFVLSNFGDSFLIHCDHALSRLMFQIAPTAMLAIAVSVPRTDGEALREREQTKG